MFNIPLVTSSTCLPPKHFWRSINLYHGRPHLVNRKLAAVAQTSIYMVRFSSENVKYAEVFTKSAILYESRKLTTISKDNITIEFVKNLVDCYDKNAQIVLSNESEFKNSSVGLFISIRILFPRLNKTKPCIEVVILNKTENRVLFVSAEESNKALCSLPFPYEIILSTDLKLSINVQTFEEADTSHSEWLADKLFPKLLNWSEEDKSDETVIHSLSLISADEYCLTYSRLKETYGFDLVKKWSTKTVTDPQKYVFEDIAIASYLICIWQKYDRSSINFVDCGCGNGLLVHLLTQEGYEGLGIDVRKRSTWDMFPKNTKLEVGTVTPSSVFPKNTWIIGNHSDELTPWIPVIALLSSPNTNFFLLPCCSYDFSGQKYIRTDTSLSTYADYLNYVRKICQMCEFDVSVDKLRIPSTKRTCLIGVRKKCSIVEFEDCCKEIKSFINIRCGNTVFTPRSDIEKVRNCTQLNRDLICKLVQTCVNIILEKDNNVILKRPGETWNKGGSITLAELASDISREDLKQLKKECGGLQTLLRNHRYIFEFTAGKVSLRLPVKLVDSSKYKDKPCWFYKNHPDGCLFDESCCGYNHQ